MYTVILYRKGNAKGQEGNQLNIERFRFLFFSMEQDDKLIFYEIAADAEECDVIRKIDNVVGTHRVWRLLVFDWECKISISEHTVKTQDEKLQKLLQYYTRSTSGKIQEICKYYPEEVWYVGWMKKQDVSKVSKVVMNELVDSSVSNLRAFSLIVDLSSRMQQRYSEFMACCSLLVLSVNQFPIGFLSPLYLYFIETEIDRRRFTEYVQSLFETASEIERQLEWENRRLQKWRKEGVPCPKFVPVSEEELERNKVPDIRKIKKRIKWAHSEANMEYALMQNAYDIREWMHYPRGVMSGVVDRLSEKLDDESMAEGFLSIAGRDHLERETQMTLEKLSTQRKVALEPLDFEHKLRESEDCIRKRVKKSSTFSQKFWPYLLMAAAEAAFGLGIVNMVSDLLMAGEKIIVVEMAVFFMFLTVAGLELSAFLCRFYAKHQYVSFLKREMQGKAESMDQYLRTTLGYIAEYQYYIRLNREQWELERRWEQQSKRLEQHMYICRQNKTTAQQLRYLIDEEDYIPPMKSEMEIDFMEEPQEISYYWTPHKSSRSKAELNDSGYMLETMLGFIERFKCGYDIRLIKLEDW